MAESIESHTIETIPLAARSLLSDGHRAIEEQRYHDAKLMFARSLAVFESAEAYTYLAWMFYYEGLTDEAIDYCKRAIELDPEFGNPYNDIGSYLMQRGDLDEAIPWLQKAKQAKRYTPRHFPYLNLGRLYLRKGDVDKARQEYSTLLEIDPKNEEAKTVLQELQGLDELGDDDFDDFEDLF